MRLFLYIFILFLCTACQHSKRDEFAYKYVLNYKDVSYYTNEYNDKGLLTKQTVHTRTTTRYGTMIDVSEDVYSYDKRDSLSEIRRYMIEQEDRSRKLSMIETFTDTTVQIVYFSKYPNDTASYSLCKKDENGNIIDEHKKDFSVDSPSEYQIFRTYENGKPSSLIRENLFEKTTDERTYKYEVKSDTLFTYIYDNDKLDFKSKEYVDNEITMEISRNFDTEWLYVDSVFIEKGKRKSISYYPDGKIIKKVLYDEHGNEIEYVSEEWDRITLIE